MGVSSFAKCTVYKRKTIESLLHIIIRDCSHDFRTISAQSVQADRADKNLAVRESVSIWVSVCVIHVYTSSDCKMTFFYFQSFLLPIRYITEKQVPHLFSIANWKCQRQSINLARLLEFCLWIKLWYHESHF